MAGTIEALRNGFSLPNVEAAFGTTIGMADLDQWIEVNDPEFVKIEKQFRTNEGKINGTRGKTQRQKFRQMGTAPFKVDASVEIITWLLGLGLGNVTTTGASDPYTHVIKHPTLCSLYPYSTSFVQGIVCSGLTSGYKSYKGCVVDTLTIEGDDAGEIKLSWTFKHDGSETAQASFTFQTSVDVFTYLIGSMMTMKLYPNGSGAIDITSKVLSWKVTVNFNVQPTKVANSGLYVARYKYGKSSPKVSVEVKVSGDKSDAIYGYSDNETLCTYQLKLDAGTTPARSVQFDMSQVYVMADADSDDLEPTLSLKLDELDVIANTGPAIWTCKTGVAAYLVPLP
jgi:hypothetical protein